MLFCGHRAGHQGAPEGTEPKHIGPPNPDLRVLLLRWGTQQAPARSPCPHGGSCQRE